ncbi:MAG TPA: hypothetical protein IAB09_00835 [Candidatus Avilachnospira avicola]|nr:hypothetical protein [Candidatus Avilachnospira avicola]
MTGSASQITKRRYRDFILCLLMTVFGGIFLLWFIRAAGCDVVYSDYIRIVEEYLPDVTDPSKFFVPDILTRIPVTFFQRLINVELFHYSVTFDRVCSAMGLTACALMVGVYMRKEGLSALWFLPVFAVIFSLNKWEIILNGTSWAHVVSFALFFLNYYLLDVWYQRQAGTCGEKSILPVILYAFPFLMLLFAGEYIASYAAVMTAAYLFCAVMGKDGGSYRGTIDRKRKCYVTGLLCTLASLGLYLLSRHFAVWEHAGASDLGILEVISSEPLLIPKLFIKSFAGTVLGQQAITDFYGPMEPLSEGAVLLIGILVIAIYLTAIVSYTRFGLWRRTLFPMILMLSGGLNHVLVTASRWIFLSEDYGLSSRYGAQFMIGVIGIILTAALVFQELTERKTRGSRILREGCIAAALLFLLGAAYTTRCELSIVPYREQNYERMHQAVLNYHDYEPEELADILEWGKSEETMLRALEILEDNRLNVFSYME